VDAFTQHGEAACGLKWIEGSIESETLVQATQ
jgi:hypothetical protein